ncbi:MAG: YceI family protein [Calditrichaeota bacterium]|nr:YceI family protein [Calditrichota bacterium]MCB0289079.1 YceI family protein [Calditrichota bacterium]MCB0305322.1 YceI family protein [Calditrichota bacterium]MCB0315907.1 YceI family protein [Calditrichota bacterium]MCB9088371.1 YceI family protein [Calditrichia bacterium]
MKWLSMIMAPVFIMSINAFCQTEWKLDKAHSSVKFEAEHVVVVSEANEPDEDKFYTMGVTEGHFKVFDVSMVMNEEDLSSMQVEARIDVNSVDTDNGPRDSHLRSKDFFYADQYPEVVFKSQSVEKMGKDTYKVVGTLTMRGITKPLEMEVTALEIPQEKGKENYISITASGMLNRLDFGLRWNDMIENGVFRVSNYVKLTIQANFRKVNES